MKLGIETGSLVNGMMANSSEAPLVGNGATVLRWTDRSAYTVRSVSANGKTVVMERCSPKRIDKNGMSEVQEYDYSEHTGGMITVKLFRGKWRQVTKQLEFTDEYFSATDGLSWMNGRKEITEECTDENGRIVKHPKYTKETTKYSKINILWGHREEYYDYSF